MTKWLKRTAIFAAAMALLAADAALTWRLAARKYVPRAQSAASYSAGQRDPLEQYRLEREQLRAREEAQLNEIIHAQDSDAQIVAQAQTRLMELMESARQESDIEGVLRGRGFEDVLASVASGSASILVRTDALNARQTAVIMDLVMRRTGLTGGNVKIIPVK